MIIHFNVDQSISKFLSGKKNSLNLIKETVSKVTQKEKITVISIKSQSVITKEVLEELPNLKLIIARTVGTDNIDLQACKEKGIAVYNIPNYGAQNIAQHAIALILCAARRIIPAQKDTQKGNFSYENFLGTSMTNKILGVVGTGKIGLEVIKIAKSLGMKILAYDVFENKTAEKSLGFSYVSLENLLKNTDVITLHAPYIKETYHLLNEKKIKLIKPNAILINTARGELIDTKALVKNINKFSAVCLDVLEKENEFSKKHPLLKFENVIITPHIAFFTDESLKVIAQETMSNIERYKKEEKTNRIV